jgi:hypothetical protein
VDDRFDILERGRPRLLHLRPVLSSPYAARPAVSPAQRRGVDVEAFCFPPDRDDGHRASARHSALSISSCRVGVASPASPK